jgi:hypothetical protein
MSAHMKAARIGTMGLVHTRRSLHSRRGVSCQRPSETVLLKTLDGDLDMVLILASERVTLSRSLTFSVLWFLH